MSRFLETLRALALAAARCPVAHHLPLARFGQGRNAKQMRLRSPWLAELSVLTDVDCFWTPCDQIVNPAEMAILPGSRAHRVDGVGHMGLVHSDEAWQCLQTALAGSSVKTPRRI